MPSFCTFEVWVTPRSSARAPPERPAPGHWPRVRSAAPAPATSSTSHALDSVPEMREVLGLFEGVAPGATGEVKSRRPARRTGWGRSRHPLRRWLPSRGPPLSPRNITRGLHPAAASPGLRAERVEHSTSLFLVPVADGDDPDRRCLRDSRTSGLRGWGWLTRSLACSSGHFSRG